MCEELHDPFQDQVECARYRAERDALAQRMEEIASEIDRTLSGVEGIEDAPAMRWARGLREALGALHLPRIGYEDIEAARWVRDHGGLEHLKSSLSALELFAEGIEMDTGRVFYDESMGERCVALRNEVKSRLMPEGMAWLLDVWPKWSNGEYCKFGDWWTADKYGDYEPKQLTRLAFFTPEQLREWEQDEGDNFGYEWDFMRPSDTTYRPDKVEPPAPKVLAADGEPLEVGQTVYHVNTGSEYSVRSVTNGGARLSKGDRPGGYCRADYLTHERPDSWQRLGEDADNVAHLFDAFDEKASADIRDLVRRAKALAGVSE